MKINVASVFCKKLLQYKILSSFVFSEFLSTGSNLTSFTVINYVNNYFDKVAIDISGKPSSTIPFSINSSRVNTGFSLMNSIILLI